MTEDDTFRVLTRITWKEMRNLFVTWPLLSKKIASVEEISEFLESHGWTYEEFNKHFPENGLGVHNKV